MSDNIFDKKYVGDHRYMMGWNIALENFYHIQTEENKKRKKTKSLLRFWHQVR
jgi:hypothetical protein